MRYPYSRPHLSDLDTQAVLDVLQGQYLTQGPVVEQLESALENLFSVKHAVICNSGTAALHMTYHGLGLGPEAGLITSPITFLATRIQLEAGFGQGRRGSLSFWPFDFAS